MPKRSKTNGTATDWFPSEAELKHMITIKKSDPELLAAHTRGEIRSPGRPKLAHKKQVVSLRLDPAVLAAFRASGSGWQSRVNMILREHMPQ
jgi:uncharacterized protein (DUF4415 family)